MPKVYQVVTNCHNAQGNFFQNVFHYELSEGGSGTTPFQYADALIDAWLAAIEGAYLDLFGNDVKLDYVQAKRIQTPGGPTSSRIVGDDGSGSNLSVSSGAAADFQWQHAGPLNRPGHSYIPCFQSGALQGDVFQPSYLARAATFTTAMVNPLTLAGALGSADFVIWSRKTSTAHIVTLGQVIPKATVMGRRLLPQI
jgi:hypothetical protein